MAEDLFATLSTTEGDINFWRHELQWIGGLGIIVMALAVLPLLGVYKPIWKYDLGTLWKDLSTHLVYGTATATAGALRGARGARVR